MRLTFSTSFNTNKATGANSYADQQVATIGGTGVMLVQNQSVPPETEIAEYRGTLYIDERSGAKMAAELRETARQAAQAGARTAEDASESIRRIASSSAAVEAAMERRRSTTRC